jgi:hypothetical protein
MGRVHTIVADVGDTSMWGVERRKAVGYDALERASLWWGRSAAARTAQKGPTEPMASLSVHTCLVRRGGLTVGACHLRIQGRPLLR